jgi:ribosomal protein S18 acetylase RimI-like enzyme
MPSEIRTLERDDWPAAADLLARRHAADRRAHSALPARYESPDEAFGLLAALFESPDAAGVIAWRDGRPAGFLAGRMYTPSPRGMGAKFRRPRSAGVPYEGYALDDHDDGELYRELYAALAPAWVERGYYSHYIEVAAHDFEALEAFNTLGFGRQITLALRRVAERVEPVEGSRVQIERAGPRDLETIMRLIGLLGEHHASSPSFLPYLREPDAEIEETERELLDDWANGHFIATRDGTVLGMQTFRAPAFMSLLATPERAIYLSDGIVVPEERRSGVGRALLAESMHWAEDAGHDCCLLHFLSANLSASRFWQANGFWPLSHTLARHIDDRIAWAHAQAAVTAMRPPAVRRRASRLPAG